MKERKKYCWQNQIEKATSTMGERGSPMNWKAESFKQIIDMERIRLWGKRGRSEGDQRGDTGGSFAWQKEFEQAADEAWEPPLGVTEKRSSNNFQHRFQRLNVGSSEQKTGKATVKALPFSFLTNWTPDFPISVEQTTIACTRPC